MLVLADARCGQGVFVWISLICLLLILSTFMEMLLALPPNLILSQDIGTFL